MSDRYMVGLLDGDEPTDMREMRAGNHAHAATLYVEDAIDEGSSATGDWDLWVQGPVESAMLGDVPSKPRWVVVDVRAVFQTSARDKGEVEASNG